MDLNCTGSGEVVDVAVDAEAVASEDKELRRIRFLILDSSSTASASCTDSARDRFLGLSIRDLVASCFVYDLHSSADAIRCPLDRIKSLEMPVVRSPRES